MTTFTDPLVVRYRLLTKIDEIVTQSENYSPNKTPARQTADSIIELIDGKDPDFPGMLLLVDQNPKVVAHQHYEQGLPINADAKLSDPGY